MRSDARWLVVTAGNLVFLFIVGQLNHHLAHAPFAHGPVYLIALGLPVAFAALRLNLTQGLVATVLTALAAEAALPLRWGALTIGATACFCFTIGLRPGFNRMNTASALATALLLNLALMFVLTLAAPFAPTASMLGRLTVDALASQAFLAALTGWFFSGQVALLEAFGYRPETELRETV